MYGHKSYASIISLQWPQIIWIRYDVPQLELIKSDERRVHMNTGITELRWNIVKYSISIQHNAKT